MWFILALIATISWGIQDVFIKAGTDEKDIFSEYKIAVHAGVCFGILELGASFYSESGNSVIQLLQSNIWLSVIPVLYAASSLLGWIGFRYLNAGIMAPLKNSGGAFSTVMFLGWYAYMGRINAVWEHITYLDIIGTVLITLGVMVWDMWNSTSMIMGGLARSTNLEFWLLFFR